MLNRFQGIDGKKRLITALMEQRIIHGDESLATEIAEIAELKEYPGGTELACQGDIDSDIYFIIVGCVSVYVNGCEIAKRQAGLHVGEMALIDPTVKRSATIKASEHTVVVKITEPLFTDLADKHPKLWRRIAVELANRLRERGKLIKQPNEKPHVFIASSREYLSFAETLQNGIKSDDVIVKVWTDGIFEASATAIESLAAVIEAYDFGIVIFGADDLVASRGNEKPAPRDNVVFELGLMIALKINDAVINIINPCIKNQYSATDFSVSHGVGIDTSDLLVARSGIRGANDLVWVGPAANYAAKLASLRQTKYSTWITKKVFESINDEAKYNNDKLIWETRNWSKYNQTVYCSSYRWKV